jgi:hypothetical protein
VEGLSPRGFEYIVGDVTISLARLLQPALPGQIIFGAFQRPLTEDTPKPIDSIEFLAVAQRNLERFRTLEIENFQIEDIRMYFSSSRKPDGGTRAKRFLIQDKHGIEHALFNMQLDLNVALTPPVQLGIRGVQLSDFEAAAQGRDG